jgi:hypothetical protein
MLVKKAARKTRSSMTRYTETTDTPTELLIFVGHIFLNALCLWGKTK